MEEGQGGNGEGDLVVQESWAAKCNSEEQHPEICLISLGFILIALEKRTFFKATE